MNKPKVGQVVFRLNTGNAARNKEQVLKPAKVMKVGRKYFYATIPFYEDSEFMWTQYYIDSGIEKTEFTSNSRIYETEQEWLDENECAEIHKNLRHTFSYNRNGLSLDALRRISRIVDAEFVK